jgi:hypothetical protein
MAFSHQSATGDNFPRLPDSVYVTMIDAGVDVSLDLPMMA